MLTAVYSSSWPYHTAHYYEGMLNIPTRMYLHRSQKRSHRYSYRRPLSFEDDAVILSLLLPPYNEKQYVKHILSSERVFLLSGGDNRYNLTSLVSIFIFGVLTPNHLGIPFMILPILVTARLLIVKCIVSIICEQSYRLVTDFLVYSNIPMS